MAFFSDTTNAPKIVDGNTFQVERLTIFVGTPSYWRRTITTSSYRFTWLTQAAADSIAAAKTTATVTAASQRVSDDGAYQVAITARTIGEWEEDT